MYLQQIGKIINNGKRKMCPWWKYGKCITDGKIQLGWNSMALHKYSPWSLGMPAHAPTLESLPPIYIHICTQCDYFSGTHYSWVGRIYNQHPVSYRMAYWAHPAVTHPGTNRAQRCLTLVIWREPVRYICGYASDHSKANKQCQTFVKFHFIWFLILVFSP